jgi:CDP-4-dehydro-6-deoxyglucose reductase
MSLLAWQTAIINDIQQLTEHTRKFLCTVKDAETFYFKPGQFITLDLPIHERQSKRLRSYTIASAPAHANTFEIIVVALPEGKGSHYLFEQCSIGSEVKFRGPLGSFILDDLTKDICMICTGTGIAPFRSQLLYLMQNNIALPEIHLVFGTRYVKDILFFEEMMAIQEREKNFHYHLTLSRENAETYKGEKGYVHTLYEKICEYGKRDMHFYLCGWRPMVDEARKRLAGMHYPTSHIHFELYG